MKNTFTIFILLFFCLFEIAPLTAQNIIWSEDFGTGQIPSNWANIDASGQVSAVWNWYVGNSFFPGQPNFTSPTSNNGFAMFSSYNAGALPTSHDVRLTTTAINCNALSTVIVKFSNQYAYFSPNGVSIAELGVSTDGTTFNYYPILTNITPNNYSIPETVEQVDISTIAAGQSTVYLQFRWRGNWEYTWFIDDIVVQDALTTPLANDMKIETYLPPYSHQIPVNQVDTFFFEAVVKNDGTSNQTNINVEAKITNSNNQLLFSDIKNLNTITINTTKNAVFNNYFLPQNLPKGNYRLSYIVSQDSIDENLSNNKVDFDFIISDTTFSIDNGVNYAPFAAGPGAALNEGAYGIANYYFIPNDGTIATSITFALYNAFDRVGENIELFLYQVDTNNDGNLDDNNDGIFNSGDLGNPLAIKNYVITGLESSGQLITMPLENFNNPNDEIPLLPNSSYIVYLKYSGQNLFLITVGEPIPYGSISTIGVNTSNDTWILGGLPNGLLAVLRLNIGDLGTATLPILKENSLIVSPNPTSDFIHLSIDLEEFSNIVYLSFMDINGKIIQADQLELVKQTTFKYNVNDLSAGIYFITIKTAHGTRTEKIIISK